MKSEKKKCNSNCADVDIKSNQLSDKSLESVNGGSTVHYFEHFGEKEPIYQDGDTFVVYECGLRNGHIGPVSFDNLEDAQRFARAEIARKVQYRC